MAVPPETVARALLGRDETVLEIIVWQLRLPRTLLAMLIGASLGLSGAVLQGLLRNPLAEPGLLGISAAAALGAVLSFYSGFAALFLLALPLEGMTGAAVAVALLLLLLLSVRRGLDALSLGEDAAASLGFELRSIRLRAVFGTALAVGAAVSVSGTIGFVGLVVPHLLRPLVGHEPGRLLVVSALGGALLLTATDIVVRLMAPGPELKIGVLTALFGAPFFLVLLLRQRREQP